jgi:hypothetical protein
VANGRIYIDIATLSTFALLNFLNMVNIYGRSLAVASPFSVPVGGDPDVSGVRVKGGNEL